MKKILLIKKTDESDNDSESYCPDTFQRHKTAKSVFSTFTPTLTVALNFLINVMLNFKVTP